MERAELVKKALEGINTRPKGKGIIGSTNNMEKNRALKGLCGKCIYLKIDLRPDGVVNLDCSNGYSPVGLFMKTPFGEEANCAGYQKEES